MADIWCRALSFIYSHVLRHPMKQHFHLPRILLSPGDHLFHHTNKNHMRSHLWVKNCTQTTDALFQLPCESNSNGDVYLSKHLFYRNLVKNNNSMCAPPSAGKEVNCSHSPCCETQHCGPCPDSRCEWLD